MAQPVALISADWHARRADRVWYRRETIAGDTSWSVQQINRIAAEYNVKYVLLAGDLFDLKLQQSDALQIMRQSLDLFQMRNQRVLFVQGQHERAAPPLLSAIHVWPEHIDRAQIHIPELDCRLYGLDYQNPLDVEAALKSVPDGAAILMTHQVWKDFLGEDRGDAWLHWVPSHTHIVISGDFHQTLDEQRGPTRIISPGSICMQQISEPPVKYVYIMYSDHSVRRVQLRTRRFFESLVHSDDELTAFVDTWRDHPARAPQPDVPANIATSLLRVQYRADIPEARQRIEQAVGSDAHLFLKPIPVVQEVIDVDANRRTEVVMSGGLEGCISAYYGADPLIRADAVRLARSRDLQTDILAIFKERLNGFDSSREGTLQDSPAGAG